MSYGSANISLLEEEIKSNLNDLEKNYLDFIKLFKEINDYKTRIGYASRADYNSFKEDLEEKKAEMNSIIVNIQNSYKYLEQSHPSSKELKKKVKNKVKIINDNFADKLNNYKTIVKEIGDKEKRFSEDNSDGMSLDHSNRFSQSGYSDSGNVSSISEDKLQINEYRDTYLEERQNVIEGVKKISQKVAEISKEIKENVFQQGEMINDIENNVVEVNENTKKADEEIKEVEKITRNQNKRICTLLIIMAILLLIITYIVYTNFFKQKA